MVTPYATIKQNKQTKLYFTSVGSAVHDLRVQRWQKQLHDRLPAIVIYNRSTWIP